MEEKNINTTYYKDFLCGTKIQISNFDFHDKY